MDMEIFQFVWQKHNIRSLRIHLNVGRPLIMKFQYEVELSAGAEFIVMVCGDIMTMPGLPKVPAAEGIDIDDEGNIVGLF